MSHMAYNKIELIIKFSLFGSAMLGRLIGSSLANSMNSGLNPSSSHSASSQSLHSYSLSGARVPFPFGTAKTREGIGVDEGPWLPPAPSVASLIKSKMPGQNGGEQMYVKMIGNILVPNKRFFWQ